MNLEQAFDPRRNALNAMRLLLAVEVILWHSFPVTGRMPPAETLQLLFAVGVDGFFAISGFLITRSWLTNPSVREYVAARALRILPGLYVCLFVTAFVIAPIGVALQGGSVARLLLSWGPIEYVLENAAVLHLHFDVGGTPTGVPFEKDWNASLWSLFWELLCYLAVLVLGVLGLATRRWISPLILIIAVTAAAFLPPLTFPGVWTIPQLLARTATMFAAGAVMYHWRDRVPARWSLVAVSMVIVVVASIWLPDYRLVAALPLAYAVIVSGVLIKNKRMRLRTDLSYGVYVYAFPMQQLLAIVGLFFLNPVVFFLISTISTLPIAALSWFLVEKRALALKSRFRRKQPVPEPQAADSGQA